MDMLLADGIESIRLQEIGQPTLLDIMTKKCGPKKYIHQHTIQKGVGQIPDSFLFANPMAYTFSKPRSNKEVICNSIHNDYLNIIISDIDLFKTINDTYGHQADDQFLIRVANLLKNNARSSDVVCRYGGEEFLLVIPGASMKDAYKRADEIREKCSGIVTEYGEQGFKVTMSFGVATYPTHGQEAEEIIIKADKAL